MRWALLFVAILMTTGCRKPRDKQAELVNDLTHLSQDQCLKRSLSAEARKRVIAKAKAGTVTEANLDAYIDDVRARRAKAEKTNLGVDSFCRMQVNAWKKHFGG